MSSATTYDNAGNPVRITSGGVTTTLTYDAEHRLTSLSGPVSDTFTYNGLGLRVGKTDSTGTRSYICDGTDAASAVLSDGAATYTPGLSERRGGASHFTHADALGTTRGLTDSTQSATDGLLFDGFGLPVSRSGSMPTPFGFVGAGQYQTDGDTGLMLLGHRYYDASVGRFLTADPAQAGGNWYAYCDNNPQSEADPSGYDPSFNGQDPVSPFPIGGPYNGGTGNLGGTKVNLNGGGGAPTTFSINDSGPVVSTTFIYTPPNGQQPPGTPNTGHGSATGTGVVNFGGGLNFTGMETVQFGGGHGTAVGIGYKPPGGGFGGGFGQSTTTSGNGQTSSTNTESLNYNLPNGNIIGLSLSQTRRGVSNTMLILSSPL